MSRGSYRMTTKDKKYGIKIEVSTQRIYLGVHLGRAFRSWWIGGKGA